MHRVRSRIVKSRTMLINEICDMLVEFGIVINSTGVSAVRKALPFILEDGENSLSFSLREFLGSMYEELVEIDKRLEKFNLQLSNHAKVDERVARLQQLPGVGPITASAIVAAVGDAKQFKQDAIFRHG